LYDGERRLVLLPRLFGGEGKPRLQLDANEHARGDREREHAPRAELGGGRPRAGLRDPPTDPEQHVSNRQKPTTVYYGSEGHASSM
jgi:hypothetical protein